MSTHRHRPETGNTPSPGKGRHGPVDTPGKRTLVETLATGASGAPSATVADRAPSSGGELPHRAGLEQAFGRSLGDVVAHTGVAEELAPFGAQALTAGNVVAFADEHPSPALAAHEAAHVLQNQQAGVTGSDAAGTAMASGMVAPRDSPAEAEADAVASEVAVRGLGQRLAPITAAPAAHVHLSPNLPVPRLDKKAEAETLRALVSMRDQKRIVELLEQNAQPEHMYALHRSYGSALVPDIERTVTVASYWARARVYLGEQMSLAEKLRSRSDAEAILRDLSMIPDARALELFQGDAVDVRWTTPPSATPGETWAPMESTLNGVRSALHARLSDDDYYRAMRFLLDKANRALASQRAQLEAAPPTPGLDGFVLRGDAVLAGGAGATGMIVGPLAVDPVSKARVDLAEERIRAADQASLWVSNPAPQRDAVLVLTDLSRSERQTLAGRLAERPLINLGGFQIARDALEVDEATVIKNAIEQARGLAYVQRKALTGVGLDTALERAGQLIREAHGELAALPADAPAAARAKAEAKVKRLEEMFFGADSKVLDTLRGEASAVGGTDHLESQLRLLGADPLTIASERLRRVTITDVDALLAALKKIAPELRQPALQRSGQLDALWGATPLFTADQRELLGAYLWQGLKPVVRFDVPQPPAAQPGDPPPITMPFELGRPMFGGPRPEVTIALFDVLSAMDRRTANEVLPRLVRLSPEDRKAVFEDSRYLAKFAMLPSSDQKDADFKAAMRDAADPKIGPAAALENYPIGGGNGDIYQKVMLEKIGAKAALTDPAQMRRAYVIVSRLGGVEKVIADPSLLAKLDPEEQHIVRPLVGAPHQNGLAHDAHVIDSDEDQVTAAQIMYGQPQLTGGSDPNIEAEFMLRRLGEAAGVRSGPTLMDSFNSAGPSVDESVTEFVVLYRQCRPGGVTRGELAQLAEIYYRALRRIDTYREANESFARSAAQVVGAVVATIVVTIASAGTLTGPAIAALATVSGAASAAATGAAIRINNSATSVMRDAGAGAVEGIAAVAGAGLAAKVIRGGAAGISAGRAAATAGAHAVERATGFGAQIAEAAIMNGVSGGAGELFQTATDEATWDHGIAEAFATMLAAVARGTAMGAITGGVLGGAIGGVGKLARLASRVGADSARGAGELLEAAGVRTDVLDHLTTEAQDKVVHAAQLVKAGQLAEAERVLTSVEGMTGASRDLLLHAARARVAVQTAIELGPVELDGLKIWPRPVDDAEFARLAGGERADALVRIENGKPEIIARRGAPAAAIREEVIHLYQYQTDIAMRIRMDGLSKEHLARWDSLSPGEKLGLHIDKLEVEADAQRRIIDHLSTRAADDPEIATRVLDAEETLYLLGQRIEGLRAAQGLPRIDLRQLGIERAPQLFSRGAHTPTRVTGPKADAVRAFVGRTPRPKITDAGADQELSTLGYRVDRSKATGTYFRISRPPKHANDLPHLSIEDDGTIVEGKVGSSFTERRDDAAREWNSVAEKESEIARKVAAGELNAEHAATQWADAQRVMAAEWRSALQRLIDAGTIDTGSAGLYLRWGPCIEELVRRSEAPRLNLKHFVDRLRPGKAGRAADDEFREVVRREIIDQLKTIEDPARRSDKLHEWLDLQPSEGAKGELFSQYQRTAMDAHTDEVGNNVYRTGDRPGTITAAGQVKARTPDGVIEVLPNVENELPRGNYLLENKTGPGAFKLKQIEDLTRASDPATGFRRSATSADRWDGVVVVFSRRSEAATAARALQSSPLTGPLVGRGRVGIHVMALDRDGVFRLVTPKPGAVGP